MGTKLNNNLSLSDKLAALHALLKHRYRFIERLSVAVYDPKTDRLKTFIESGEGDHPLRHYAAKLSDAPSLQGILDRRRPRVVNDLDIFAHGRREHTKRIEAIGYGASYTLPMYVNSVFSDSSSSILAPRRCFRKRCCMTWISSAIWSR